MSESKRFARQDRMAEEDRSGWIEASPLLILVAAIAVSSTTGVGIGDSWFDEQRIIGILALCVAALIVALRYGDRSRWSGASTVLLPLLAIGLVSSLVAQRPYFALLEWSMMVVIAVLVVGTRGLSLHNIRLAGALFGAIVPTAYVSGVVANYVSEVLLGFDVGSLTFLVGFSNPRFPAQLEALSIPFLFLAWRLAPKGFWRASIFVIAIAWWACLIGSGSRTSWIALGIALAVVGWIERRSGFAFTRFQCICAALGGIAFLTFFYMLPALLGLASAIEEDRFSNISSAGKRAILWKLGFDAAIAHPLFGIGPMHYAYLFNNEGAHPHNFWLQLASEWGLLVAGVVLSAVVVLWRRLLLKVQTGRSSTEEKETGLVLLAALSVWLVGTQADGFMVVPTSQLASTIILALCVAFAAKTDMIDQRVALPAALVVKLCCIALTLIATFMLASLMFTSYGNSGERERVWRNGKHDVYFHPRFWQQGWIGPDQDVTARPP